MCVFVCALRRAHSSWLVCAIVLESMKDVVLVSSVIKRVGTMPLPDAGDGLLDGRLGWSCHGHCSRSIRVVDVTVRTIVINVTIITSTLLLLCIGVSDAMAAPPLPAFQLPSSGAAATWNAGKCTPYRTIQDRFYIRQ